MSDRASSSRRFCLLVTLKPPGYIPSTTPPHQGMNICLSESCSTASALGPLPMQLVPDQDKRHYTGAPFLPARSDPSGLIAIPKMKSMATRTRIWTRIWTRICADVASGRKALSPLLRLRTDLLLAFVARAARAVDGAQLLPPRH